MPKLNAIESGFNQPLNFLDAATLEQAVRLLWLLAENSDQRPGAAAAQRQDVGCQSGSASRATACEGESDCQLTAV